MADIRIKDLATTASTTALDDFMAVDGTTNGTRKLSAATPSFATSVTVPSVVGPTSTDLTLTGGTTGASLVLGHGTTAGNITVAPSGTGYVDVTKRFYTSISFPAPTGMLDNIGTLVGPAGSGSSLAVNVPSVSSSYPSGLMVDGSYASLTSTVNLKAFGVLSGGGYGSNLTFSTSSNATLAEVGRFTKTGNLLIGTTTDTASRLKLVGTDSSGPKTWTASSAALSGALFDSYQDSGGNGFQRYTDIVSLQDSDGVNGGGVIRFVTNSVSSDSGAEAMRVTKAQNLLIGTTTDISGTGGLKVAGTTASTNTTSGALVVTGGVGVGGAMNVGGASVFGGNLSVSRASGTPTISVAITAAGGVSEFPLFQLLDARAGGTNWNIENGRTSGVLSIRSSNGEQVTVNGTTGAATFAGAVSAQGTGAHTFGTTNTVSLQAGAITGTNSTAGGTTNFLIRNLDNTNAASAAVIQATVGGANAGDPRILLTVDAVVDWSLGVDNSDSDSFKIGPSGTVGTSTALTLTTAGAATFAGAVRATRIGVGTAGQTYRGIDVFSPLTASAGEASTFVGTNTLTTAANNDVLAVFNSGSGFSNAGAFTNTTTASFYAPSKTHAGAFGYGLFIGNVTGATNNYAIRTLSGIVSIGDATTSTNTTSGALVVTGGVGVGGAMNVGGAATFAGAVAIGNTVNTVSPTSLNRTVTMVIGGVTYYLAAKTTND